MENVCNESESKISEGQGLCTVDVNGLEVGVDESLHGLGEVIIGLANAGLLDGALELVNSDETVLKAIMSAQVRSKKFALSVSKFIILKIECSKLPVREWNFRCLLFLLWVRFATTRKSLFFAKYV
jgi:hypothetical protein